MQALEFLTKNFKSEIQSNNKLPIAFISGEEPALIKDVYDSLARHLQSEDYEKSMLNLSTKFDDNWRSFFSSFESNSLFSIKQLFVVNLDKLKLDNQLNESLINLFSNQEYFTDKFVIFRYASTLSTTDKKITWLSNLIQKTSFVIEAKALTLKDYPKWIDLKARRLKLKVDEASQQLLAEHFENNLLAIEQILVKIHLYNYDEIKQNGSFNMSTKDLDGYLEENAHYKIFAFNDAVLTNNKKHSLKILQNLEKEGVSLIAITGLFSKMIEELFALKIHSLHENSSISARKLGIWSSKINLYCQAVARIEVSTFKLMLEELIYLDRHLKGAVHTNPHPDKLNPWLIFNNIMAKLLPN